MSPAEFILTFLLVLMVAFVFAAWVGRRRQRSFDPHLSDDKVFRCVKERCNYVYTDDPDVDRSRCPQCGQMNESVTF